MKNLYTLLVFTLMLLAIPCNLRAFESNIENSNKIVLAKDTFVGGWAYTLQGAPEGYEKGFLLVLKEDKTYKAQVQVGGTTFLAENIVVKKNTMTFHVMVEGQKVMVALTASGSKLSGTSTTAEGVFQITGEKTLSAGE